MSRRQNTRNLQSEVHLSLVDLTRTIIFAKRILEVTEVELARDSPLRFAPDGHFEFVLHAAVFLLKVQKHVAASAQPAEHGLIRRVAGLMSAVSRNQRDTPALYAALLLELCRAVSGGTEEYQEDDLFSPVISAQTKQFAKLLMKSSSWRSVVFPGINASNVERTEM